MRILSARALLPALALLALGLLACSTDARQINNKAPQSDMAPFDRRVPTDHHFADAADAPPGDGGLADATSPDLTHHNGPVVTITAPMAGAIIGPGTITVTATIVARTPADGGAASPVDLTTIRTFVGATMTAMVPDPSTPDSYTATLNTSDYTAGTLAIRVDAKDQAGNEDFAEVDVILDLGPTFVVRRPAMNERTRDQLIVDFDVVTPDATVTVDPTTVKASSLAQDIALTPSPSLQPNATTFHGTLDLQPLNVTDGPQVLTLSATDSNAVSSQLIVSYYIDRTGPDIEISVPATGMLYGNVITVTAKVTDPAGVQAGTVIAQLSNGGGPIMGMSGNIIEPLTLDNGGAGDTYTAPFDVRQIPNNIVLPTIVIVAQDSLGNQSHVGYEFVIDNVGPIIELDPPADTAVSLRGANGIQISFPFDIVGPEAVNDFGAHTVPPATPDLPATKGQPALVPQLFVVHADMEDDGNSGVGALFKRISGIDPATAKLYILDDTTKPLAVDTDGDGICDDINPEVVPVPGAPPQPGKALELDMAQVPVGGTGYFPGDMTAPNPLCDTTEITLVPSYTSGGDSPLWGVQPVVSGNRELCVGQEVDTGNNISEGWVCVAAAASDKLGNRGVSPPLRLCICKLGVACAACADLPSTANAPDCTGTAAPNTAVTNVPCTPRRFAGSRIVPQ